MRSYYLATIAIALLAVVAVSETVADLPAQNMRIYKEGDTCYVIVSKPYYAVYNVSPLHNAKGGYKQMVSNGS